MPSPTTVLRVSRLRCLALLYNCASVTPWAVLRADTRWLALVRDDLQWLWRLIRSTTTLPDPAGNFSAWEEVLCYHRTYWKRLLQRAVKLETLHCEDRVLLLPLHQDALRHLEGKGSLAYRPQVYQRAPDQEPAVFGCMCCRKRCRSHGGEWSTSLQSAWNCRAHPPSI